MGLRRPKRELEAEIKALQTQLKVSRSREERLRGERQQEQTERIAAQRGLVPYVRSLEELHRWIQEIRSGPGKSPSWHAAWGALEDKMRELELWEIKLGYDPDEDISLSIVSPLYQGTKPSKADLNDQ